MSGETEKDVSAFTTDSLHVHLRALMDERDRRYKERFRAQKEAVSEVARTTEARFQGVNEFRAALSEQTNTFIPRSEAEAADSRLSERIDEVVARLNAFDITAGTSTGHDQGVRLSTGVLVTVVTVAVAVIAAVVAIANYAAR